MTVSANARKHMTKNPIKRWMLENFKKNLVAEVVALNPTSILDVGCGEGFIAEAIMAQLPQVTYRGIDMDETAVSLAQELNPKAEISTGDVLNLQFKDESFDLVICSEVLEHVTPPLAALKELHRVSKQHLILSVPHEPLFWGINLLTLNHIKSFGNAPGHINHWTTGGFKKFVTPLITLETTRAPFPWTLVRGTKKPTPSL